MAYVGQHGKRNWLNDYNQRLSDWLARPSEAETRGSNPSGAPVLNSELQQIVVRVTLHCSGNSFYNFVSNAECKNKYSAQLILHT